MEPITIEMVLTKTTKGTYVYSANKQNAAISTVYVNKTAFEGKPPEDITIIVKD